MALQHRAVSWYHHYLQHPGHTRLEETLRAAMYWKGMRNTIRKYMTAKYKRSTCALSVARLTDENDVTDGVKRSGQLNINRKIFLSSFERC